MKTLKVQRIFMIAVATCLLAPSATWARDTLQYVTSVDAADLPGKKRTSLGLYLTAGEVSGFREAHEDALFIDIRTRAEVAFVGIAAEADRNIPYMVMDDFWAFDEAKGTYSMAVNSEFAPLIDDLVSERGLSKDAPIILICRSGSRSARASDLLAQLGYTSVISVVDGFEGDKAADGVRNVNGWKNSGLEWSYKIRSEQAY